MGPRPWKPEVQLRGALQRGELTDALRLAAEVREDRPGRPLDLDEALEFLPVVARASPREYDTWAMRWLTRRCAETPAASLRGLLSGRATA